MRADPEKTLRRILREFGPARDVLIVSDANSGGEIRGELRQILRALKARRETLTTLTAAIRSHIAALDAEMKRPSTPERGKTIAQLCNALELANDSARFFVLNEDYRKPAEKLAQMAERRGA